MDSQATKKFKSFSLELVMRGTGGSRGAKAERWDSTQENQIYGLDWEENRECGSNNLDSALALT
jgi:hypothetical protein